MKPATNDDLSAPGRALQVTSLTAEEIEPPGSPRLLQGSGRPNILTRKTATSARVTVLAGQ
jgi:hypothetical protein